MEVNTIRVDGKIASLEAEKVSLERALKKLPKGNLILAKNGKCWKWYLYCQKKTEYIPKKKRTLVEKLALKKYLLSRIEELENEINGLRLYSKEVKKPLKNSLPQNEEFQRLLKPLLFDEVVNTWLNEPYELNTKYEEHLTVKTKDGKYVRSKSERDIYNLLTEYNIPFKYEAPLSIDGRVVYPDFTIMHPITHQIFYWEHCGRMDDMKYVEDNLYKYTMYIRNGIIPATNLILTFETQKNPFDISYAEELIRFYFVD